MENGNNNSIIKAGLILALAIAAFFGYLYFNEKQGSTEKSRMIELKTSEIIHTNSKLDSIARELDLKMNELASLGVRVDELELVKISLEKDRQNLLSSNAAELKDYSNKIKNYERILAQKDSELKKLREDNQKLAGENSVLNQNNQLLQNSNTELEGQKAALTDTVKQYAQTNRELNDKVTIGAALRPVNYVVAAVNSRGKEREGDEFKVRRVDRIKVSFKLAENPLTRKETKTIYLRLLNPSGNVVSDMALGSGVFRFGGKETVYTAKQNINYTDNHQTVEFVHDNDKRYEKGQYKIEIYAEGFRVGQTTFVIK